MGIYDLNNTFYLQHDIDDVLSTIDKLYTVNFGIEETTFSPKTIVTEKVHFTSPVCQEAFNKLIPVVKSLTKDIYAIVEVLCKSKNGEFDKPKMEKDFQRLRQLRLLNNKFKHSNDKEAIITLTCIVLMGVEVHLIEVFVNFKYKDHFEGMRFGELVKVFLDILKDMHVITIDGKH